MEVNLFEHITETQWLKIIYSYLQHQIDPQPTIALDDLAHLEVGDLDSIPHELFEVEEYDEEYVKDLLEALNLIIIKREEEDLKEQNAEL